MPARKLFPKFQRNTPWRRDTRTSSETLINYLPEHTILWHRRSRSKSHTGTINHFYFIECSAEHVLGKPSISSCLINRMQNKITSIKTADTCISLADVVKFKYLRMMLTNENCMHEEIKNRLNSENACCQPSGWKSLSTSRPQHINVKVKIHRRPGIWRAPGFLQKF
jgi:hypothetical protein